MKDCDCSCDCCYDCPDCRPEPEEPIHDCPFCVCEEDEEDASDE